MTADEARDGRQRIDKWLWFARLAKTRTAAQKLALSGQVRVNREKNRSASRPVAPGDVLTVALGTRVRVLRVLAPGVRRGPATEARLLYEDLSPPPAPAAGTPAGPDDAETHAPDKRPDKRQRRAISALKRLPGEESGSDGGF